MKGFEKHMLRGAMSDVDELTPERIRRMRRWRRRLVWRNRASATALPVVLLLALGVVASVPLPQHVERLGSGWGVHLSVDGSATGTGSALTRQEFATAQVTFSGSLAPSARRAAVTIVLQQMRGAGATTIGTLFTTANRVFNAQSTSLPALFAQMDVTPRAATTYRIAVNVGSTALASSTFALTR